LTRRITTFRKTGRFYRRADEIHRLRLYDAAALAEELRALGFRVRTLRRYGNHGLYRARVAFVARKAGE